MHVVHVIGSFNVADGGPPRSVGQMCSALCKREGVQISLVTCEASPEGRAPLDAGVNFVPALPSGGINAWIPGRSPLDAALEKLHREHPISLIHNQGIWTSTNHTASRFAARNSIPEVLAPRGMLEPWAWNYRPFKKRLAWFLYQRQNCHSAACLQATSEEEALHLRERGLKQECVIVPNGVDAPPESDCRAAGQGRKPLRTALFISRIHPKKGLPLLLKAWSKLKPEGWQLQIAGNQELGHEAELRELVRELKLEGICFLGPLFGEAKNAAYKNADLFVLPTYSENFGIVVAEALSFKVPVLTTTGTPWSNLLSARCGWWVDPTQEAIESGLAGVFATSAEEIDAMGERGRQLVLAQYGWAKLAETLLGHYKRHARHS